jgi:hypothetical protein
MNVIAMNVYKLNFRINYVALQSLSGGPDKQISFTQDVVVANCFEKALEQADNLARMYFNRGHFNDKKFEYVSCEVLSLNLVYTDVWIAE